MSNNMKKVLLVGAGFMAKEYAKVLQGMGIPFVAIANRRENAEKMREEFNVEVFEGGLELFFKNQEAIDYNYAINAVNAENLAITSAMLMEHGIENCLIEKPGFTSRKEADLVSKNAKGKKVYIAYNRRFYASVQRGMEIIEEDGGVASFSFEFTEWRQVFDNRENQENLSFLFLGNSTHVVDMAFYLAGGYPIEMTNYISGENEIGWHKMGAKYAGAGMIHDGILFSYSANWNAPGRWGIEINTKNHRLIYRPLEKLQIMDLGSVKIYEADVDYDLDNRYKAGLYREVESFLNDNVDKNLCMLDEQINNIDLYSKISGELY